MVSVGNGQWKSQVTRDTHYPPWTGLDLSESTNARGFSTFHVTSRTCYGQSLSGIRRQQHPFSTAQLTLIASSAQTPTLASWAVTCAACMAANSLSHTGYGQIIHAYGRWTHSPSPRAPSRILAKPFFNRVTETFSSRTVPGSRTMEPYSRPEGT